MVTVRFFPISPLLIIPSSRFSCHYPIPLHTLPLSHDHPATFFPKDILSLSSYLFPAFPGFSLTHTQLFMAVVCVLCTIRTWGCRCNKTTAAVLFHITPHPPTSSPSQTIYSFISLRPPAFSLSLSPSFEREREREKEREHKTSGGENWDDENLHFTIPAFLLSPSRQIRLRPCFTTSVAAIHSPATLSLPIMKIPRIQASFELVHMQ